MRHNTDINIKPVDKGSAIVIMDKANNAKEGQNN